MPLQDLVNKFSHVRFEPSGDNEEPRRPLREVDVDYIFRWMASKFLSQDAQFPAGVNVRDEVVTMPEQLPWECGCRLRRFANRGDHVTQDVGVRRDGESGGRPAMLDVRVDHGAQRVLLQVCELRKYRRVCVGN